MRKLQANAFEIGFPEGWEDHSTVTLIGPLRPTFSPNVQVNQEPRPTDQTVLQYFEEQRRELHELSGFRLLEVGDRLLGGVRADYHTYVWKIPQGVEVRQLQLATQHAGVLYTVTCSAMDSDWPNFEPSFELLLSAFKFK